MGGEFLQWWSDRALFVDYELSLNSISGLKLHLFSLWVWVDKHVYYVIQKVAMIS